MLQHLNWLEQISDVVLREVNVSLEDYIDTITMPGVLLDFVALLFLCRIYHIHVTVFTSRGVWSTSRQTRMTVYLVLSSMVTSNSWKQSRQEVVRNIDNGLKTGPRKARCPHTPNHAFQCR